MTSYREDEGQALLTLLHEHPTVPIAVDTETRGLRYGNQMIGCSISTLIDGKPYSHYFAFEHEVGENTREETRAMLQWTLEKDDHLLIFANVQFDILAFSTVGFSLDHTNFIDICTMAHLIDSEQPYDKGVDSLADYYLGDGSGKIKDKEIDKEKKTGWHNTSAEMMWLYACTDTELTYRIWLFLKDHERWTALPADIWPYKQKLIRVLLVMRRRGVRIDVPLTTELEELGTSMMAELREALGMNPDSIKDMRELFIDKLGLPVLKASKTTGLPSFTKEVMDEYDIILERMDSKLAKTIKHYRGWQKATTAAYRPYLALLDADGRLRCSYKTHGTVTGRLSSAEPNLQQIPKTTDKPWNGRVKECFIAKPGYTLVNADFSQLELRLATAYAGEQQLKEVFEDGRDIFTEMSAQLGMARHDTKTLVYSMQYGAGINRIVNAFAVTKSRAAEIRNNYFATYPLFKNLADACSNRVKVGGKVRLWSGRYRYFRYKSDNYKAMNSVIQGGAADLVERIMVKVFEEIDCDDCQMLLQVHDSITFEVRDDLVDYYIPKIKAVMEDVNSVTGDVQLDVKFAVEVGRWVE